MQRKVLYFIALVLAGPAMFEKVAWQWALFAWRTDDQSYILLVPAMAFGLIYWDRRRIFASVAEKLDFRGLIGLGTAVLLAIVAYASPAGSERELACTAFALISFWAGAFTLCFGVTAARAATFALGFMVCIVPIPASIIDFTTVTLQKGSADAVDWIFSLTGVPYLRDGFVFQLAGQGIEVARECSGIRSSLSLIVLTLIIAHESLQSNWRRVVLILCTVPIVVLKNGVRIVTLTLLAVYVDPSFLTGSLHHDGGIVFFLIGLVMLVPILHLLRRSEERKASSPPPQMAQSATGVQA
ncbi:MAG: exosortase/archaeosortase family protein [Terriglobales bacterium]